jgi:hypothetical protein
MHAGVLYSHARVFYPRVKVLYSLARYFYSHVRVCITSRQKMARYAFHCTSQILNPSNFRYDLPLPALVPLSGVRDRSAPWRWQRLGHVQAAPPLEDSLLVLEHDAADHVLSGQLILGLSTHVF